MRGIWLVAAIGACAALSSCDQDQQQAAQTAPAAPPPACACRPTAPQETAAAAQTAMPVSHHRHHSWRSRDSQMAWNGHRHWRGDYSRTDFTESVLAPYDYVSQSRVSYAESEYSYSNADYREDRGMRYRGRRGGDTIPASMSGERLDPWAGYGVRCPWL
jgi:hypothetical protein